MSISVYGNIKEKKLNIDLFKRYVNEYFLADSMAKIEFTDGFYFLYECKDFRYYIYFGEEKKPPFNVLDSQILNGEYEFAQTIMFDLCKDIDYSMAYESIIEFFIFLNKRTGSDILVTSDPHNDICYIDKDIRWSENWLNRYKERS